MLKKNDIIPLEVENCSLNGSGAGHSDGMTVFVPGTIPGEKINAHILKVKKGYCFAKVSDIVTPSPARKEPGCPVYRMCGGCVFRHMDYETEKQIKRDCVAQTLRRIGGIEVTPGEILSAGNERYRNKAQYPVREENGRVQAGFYAPHSHRVVSCSDCMLQPEIFSSILGKVLSFISQKGISAYNEETCRGLVRHLYLRQAKATGEIMLCLVINGSSLPAQDEFVSLMTSSFPQIKSMVLNINTRDTNVILGDSCRVIYGEERITDELLGVRFGISPLAFYQVNRDGAELLYSKAAEYAGLKGDEVLLDLYCGAGTIGLTMADKVKELIGVEIVPEAVEDAKFNAALNGTENARFICDDASGAAARLREEGITPDVVIIDPPRKGCTPGLIETISRMSPSRVVYVSCDVATLARDLKLFAEQGYETVSATPVDMFPGAGHVESVVLLVKLPPDDVVNIELDLTKLPVSIHDGDATYDEIKKYVLSHHGLKVSSLYISQVKRKFGLKVTEAYNKPKSENSHQPQCPPEKEKAITEALRYFKMISN